MNKIEIFEKSPNGYRVIEQMPSVKAVGVDKVIRSYLDQLELFRPKKNPIEYALLNFCLAKVLFCDETYIETIHTNNIATFNMIDERAKQVENALFYFNSSLEIFSTADYPVMYALVSIFMAKLFRERSLLITHRNFLSERSTPEDSLQYGVDHALEALEILMNSRTHKVEYAICCVELGHLYLMQTEMPQFAEDNDLREQALTYLDRAIGISEALPEIVQTMIDGDTPVRWQPNDTKTFPHHIRLLLENEPFTYLEGMSYYLMGRLEHGWGLFGSDEHDHDNSLRKDLPNEHIQQAYSHYCTAIQPRYLHITSAHWSDSHHRIALLIIRYPSLVDPDFAQGTDMRYSEVNLESAMTHLTLALRCDKISRHERMDQNFHLAQTFIAKLQRVIDSVPYGQSVTKAVIGKDGVDLIQHIEKHLQEALKRVTGANTQSVQDGYLFYFASLKLAEYRMLEAACTPNLDIEEREAFLKDSIKFLVDACVSRTLTDNIDMHYIASSQLAQVIMAAKRVHAAAKAYSKLLFVLSALVNRWVFHTRVVERKMMDDNNRHSSSGLFAAVKACEWTKLHIGPLRLHERPAAGFATWSFEECPRKQSARTDDMIANVSKPFPVPINSNSNAGQSTQQQQQQQQQQEIMKPPRSMLPKNIPPLNLGNTKKVFIAGDDLADHDLGLNLSQLPGNSTVLHDDTKSVATNGSNGSAFKPPVGAVPLSAMGQRQPAIVEDPLHDDDDGGSVHGDRPFTPYAGRMRSRVPPTKEMKEIDKSNRLSFGISNGKVAYLLPVFNARQKKANANATAAAANQINSPPNAQTNSAAIQASKQVLLPVAENKVEDGTAQQQEGRDADDEKEDENEGNGDSGEEDGNDDDGSADGESGGSFLNRSMSKLFSRPRSVKIRRTPLPQFNDNANDATNPLPDETQEEKAEASKKGMFEWLSTKKSTKASTKYIAEDNNAIAATTTATENTQEPSLAKKTSFFSSFFSSRQAKAKAKALAKAQEVAAAKDQLQNLLTIGMWASKQAYLGLLLHSRHSRLDLVMRAKRLNILDGERSCAILYKVKPKYLTTFATLREQLYALCKDSLPPISNLKELSALSMMELKLLFTAHVKIVKRLDEFENFLFAHMSKVDYFLPMVANVPIFLRDMAMFDEILLNTDVLTSNMIYEQALPLIHEQSELDKQQQREHDKSVLRDMLQAKQREKGMKDHESVSSAATSHISFDSKTTTANATAKAPVEPHLLRTMQEKQQENEEKEEVRAGKMTYSLSQELDGTSHLLAGSQGIKDLLVKHLGQDECLLLWHLPANPSHAVSCVLAWRENSQSLHDHFSSKLAVTARMDEEKKRKKESIIAGSKKTAKAPPPGKTDTKTSNNKQSATDSHKSGIADLDIKGIVIEFAKCDLLASHLMQFLQGYFNALRGKSLPQKLANSSDSLRSLSCALSITELLLMIPPHVRSLVMCCPPIMRMIPWHALLFETRQSVSSNDDSVIEMHLLERYCVRLGPSLNIWELTSIASSQLRQSIGLHRMVCIDGDDRISNRNASLHHTSNVMSSSTSTTPGADAQSVVTGHSHVSTAKVQAAQYKNQSAVAGIRGADLEVAAMASTWSADPEDYLILSDAAATPLKLETCSFGDNRIEIYRKFKEGVRIVDLHHLDSDDDNDGNDVVSDHDHHTDFMTKSRKARERKRMRELHNKKYSQKSRDKFKERKETDGNSDEDDDDDDDDSADNKNTAKQAKARRKQEKFRIMSLSMCRVLHICANKIPLSEEMIGDDGFVEASIKLPEGFELLEQEETDVQGHRNLRLQQLDQGIMSSSDIIRQLYVKNCALCVLSRFGITDDVVDNKSPIIESNCEFVEAMHLAGACTVLFPLWDGEGLGTLASLLFQLRFYSLLPSKSHDRLSINETVRRAQLWLKDVTANDAIAFVHKAPIPKKVREVIMAEMESYVSASLSTSAKPSKSASAEVNTADGNRPGGSRKFFTHFMHWGAFVVSGSGGNVHHPNLTEEVDETAALFGHEGKWNADDEELNNIEFEASVLRMEGKIEEALELEKRWRQLRMEKLKKQVNNVKQTGFNAGRGFLDILDYLDKKLLDQDSDEVSISDEEEEGSGHKDEDEEDEDIDKTPKEKPENASGPSAADALASNWLSQQQQQQQQQHDMDYGEWRGRVTNLNMNVQMPTMLSPDKKKEKIVALRNKMLSPSPNKADNYEFNMRKKMNAQGVEDDKEVPDRYKGHDDDDDEEEDGDGDDENDDSDEDEDDEDYEGMTAKEIKALKEIEERERAKKRTKRAAREIRKGVRSYAEISRQLAEKVAKKANELPLDKLKAEMEHLDKFKQDFRSKHEHDKCLVM